MIFLLTVNQKHINIMRLLFIQMFLRYFCPLLDCLKLYDFSFNVQYNAISGSFSFKKFIFQEINK